MPHQRVRKGSTVDIFWEIDGFPDTDALAPALSLTLPDGSTATYTLSPPVAPVSVSSMDDDRQTLTLNANLSGEMYGRLYGGVYIKADGTVFSSVVSDIDGSTLTLTAPLPAYVSPEMVAWETYSTTIAPTYGAGDGPTATVGALDGTIVYTVIAPGDEASEARTARYSVEIEQRTFDTGLTEPTLIKKISPYTPDQGGRDRGHRAGDYQNVIDSTEDDLRDIVAEAVEDRGYRIDRVVAIRDFFEPHVMLVRAELALDREIGEMLRERAMATIKRKVKALSIDSDDDGVVDEDINVGIRIPYPLYRGFSVNRRRFNRDDVL